MASSYAPEPKPKTKPEPEQPLGVDENMTKITPINPIAERMCIVAKSILPPLVRAVGAAIRYGRSDFEARVSWLAWETAD